MSAISLITPADARDLEFCKLLCESVDRYVTSYSAHYLIVPDYDLPLFRAFNGPRRSVIPASSLLPPWLKPLPRFLTPNGRRRWWSIYARPVSGWHVQQFLKISAASTLSEERFCILDSDVVFFRNFDLSRFLSPTPAPLFKMAGGVPGDSPLHANWVRSSHRLLGLAPPAFPADDFIGQIVIWDKFAINDMIERIEAVTGSQWTETLCRTRDISEYMLYGYFVQSTLHQRHRHVPTSKNPCLSYWEGKALNRGSLEDTLSSASESYAAFSAAAFSGTPVELIRSTVAKFANPERRVA